MMNKLTYLCFLAAVSAKSDLVPFLTPCMIADIACDIKSARAVAPYLTAGIPTIGIPSLDPLQIKEVFQDNSTVQIYFKDNTITGIKSCKIDEINLKLVKTKQWLLISCKMDLKGEYMVDGTIGALPMEGSGKYNIVIGGIVIDATIGVATIVGAEEKYYWNVMDWYYTSQVITAKFKFNNLFNGDIIQAKPVEAFIDNNLHIAVDMIATPMIDAIMARIVDSINALYVAVPMEDLILIYNMSAIAAINE